MSDQPVPSLTPLIDKALAVRHVLLVAPPHRLPQAGWLRDALVRHYQMREQDMATFTLRDAYHLPTLIEDFSDLRRRLTMPLAINLTGGSKPMTLAAWEVFNRPDDAHYYVNISTDAIDWLRPQGRPSHPIADRLHIEPYLTAWGAESDPGTPPLRDPVPGPRKTLAWQLINSTRLRNSCTMLKPLFPQKCRETITKTVANSLGLQSLYKQLLAAGLTKAATLADAIQEPQVRRFSDGGWLEEAVFEYLRSLHSQDRLMHDVVRNLRFHRRGSLQDGLINEIDVACLRDNTLHLIECKTGSLTQKMGTMNLAEQAIYKLALVRDAIGGLRCRAMLVSQNQISYTLHKRAEEKNIVIIDGQNITTLPERLRAWLHG
ncbi:MAG: hypothetical protein BWK76_25315 [Desulfobulbaceae bacterium A2]|nr:MAG: hypothetical protein BWK76_25315 [Desulfobulbaceae bacterium A2]